MLRTNVSADFIPMTSDTGDTSSFAATRGNSALPNAEAPANMCVKLNCFCAAKIRGVKFSDVNPANASFSATITLEMPLALAAASDTYTKSTL